VGQAAARGLGAAAEATNPMAFNGLAASFISRQVLFSSTVDSGSMNTVAPEADWSWMMPRIRPKSALSGMT
jgi:hypothetical protein